MRINSLWYKDPVQKWEVSKIDFFDLTLLVGVSGVGKTQILNAILNLKDVANGTSLNGVAWEISFEIDDQIYRWEGKFEVQFIKNHNWEFFVTGVFKPKIKEEKIFLNEKLIAKKEKDTIFFENKKMPKLTSNESIIKIFQEEDNIAPVYQGFKKIVFRDHTIKDASKFYPITDYRQLFSEYTTLEKIRNSELNTILKLNCLHQNIPNAFAEIVEDYKDIFPQISDVKIGPFLDVMEGDYRGETSPPIVIQFKEKGVNRWIPQSQISSGMLRTLLHISELFLLSKGTIVLIDEFENSLGVNCINVLTEDLIFENNRLQFIATSHHPYIINNIPYEYWKIVTRKGGTIKAYNAQEFDLGASSHERFMNLINLPQYKDGITSLV